ncbi:hypothetical protein EVG20_g6190 [Dentipellis fragilis]|uniref:Uncharacterized protein n=1 Tax=Dentipellis fragilis TaxID=205917 RepID=A0A4Y9YPM9_9AGAM|nr:hypothetical protein EVG20_g6190 [Dentipellis fragilis]
MPASERDVLHPCCLALRPCHPALPCMPSRPPSHAVSPCMHHCTLRTPSRLAAVPSCRAPALHHALHHATAPAPAPSSMLSAPALSLVHSMQHQCLACFTHARQHHSTPVPIPACPTIHMHSYMYSI